MLVSRYLVVTAIIALLLIPLNSGLSAEVSYEKYRGVYAYDYRSDVVIKYVLVVSEDEVVILGNLNNSAVIQVINISDLFKGPEVVFTYPLTGSLTAFAVDGYPVRYFAIGTDAGEVAVFAVDGGRLYEKLHYIQGVDYVVQSLYLLKSPESVKLAALSVNKYLPSERYVYVYDVNRKGVLRVGPAVGNMTTSLEYITPQFIAPIKVISSNNYFYDASYLLIAYTGLTAVLNINVTYVVNNTLVPGSNALIRIQVFNASTNSMVMSYAVNADVSGLAQVQVPLGYLVKVVVDDVCGRSYASTIDLTKEALPKTLPQLNITLGCGPVTTAAPSYMPCFIKVIDVSTAPLAYEVVRDLNMTVYADIPSFHALKPTNFRKYAYIIGFSDRYTYYLNLTYLDEGLDNILTLTDYLGFGTADLTFLEVDSSGSYVIAGLSDGRVKVYRFIDGVDGFHKFEQEYVMPGRPLNLKLTSLYGRPYYLIYTTGGLQIISLEPLQLPLLRLDAKLTYTFPEASYGDALNDLSVIAVGGGNRLLIIRGFNNYVLQYGNKPLDIDSTKLPSLTLTVLAPNYTAVANAKVVLTYDNVSHVFVTGGDGVVNIHSIFPGRYLLSVYSPIPYFEDLINMSVDVPAAPHISYLVRLEYRSYNISLILLDEYGAGPQVPLNIYVNRGLATSNYTEHILNLKLRYGTYNLTVSPAGGYEYFYEPLQIPLTVERDSVIELYLTRKTYNATLKVVDKVTGRILDEEVTVSINGTFKSVKGVLTTPLKTGCYLINVIMPYELTGIYKSVSRYVCVVADAAYVIEVPREEYLVEFVMYDALTNEPVVGYFDIYINGTKVLSTTHNYFNLTLPYGSYELLISPTPPYNTMYTQFKDVIELRNNISRVINVERVRYTLVVRFYDSISGTPVTPLRLYINNTMTYIPQGRSSHSVVLPYGLYVIHVVPEYSYENAYSPYRATVNLTSDSYVDAVLERKAYRLLIDIYDITMGPLLGKFNVEANGTTVATNVANVANITLPYGTYNVVVKPLPQYASIYRDSDVLSIKLFNDVNTSVAMSRRYYTLTLIISDDRDSPAVGAEVTVFDTETGSLVARGYTGAGGRYVTSLYYGSFKVVIKYGGFYDASQSIDLTTDVTQKVVLQPLPITIVLRYMPLIIIASLIAVAIVAIVRLRSRIAERLYPTEEYF